VASPALPAQIIYRPPLPPAARPAASAQTPAPARGNRTSGPEAPAENEVLTSAVVQESQGTVRRLKGKAVVETTEMRLRADEIEYDEESGLARAHGAVKFERFDTGEVLECERAEYDVSEETGKFFKVHGTTPPKVQSRPGMLTTANPFYFEGDWAERIGNRYILHQGFITSCKVPKPWWILRGKTFDIIQDDRAVGRKAWFRLRNYPLFYFPYFYKSLEKFPRQSGFLTPNIGNSSRRGKMIGIGYYWALNRSYDATYRAQFFTQRGMAHHVDFRGKPNEKTDFDFLLYGVNDSGITIGNNLVKQGGYLITFNGRSELGRGFYARGQINYLSSFTFRQAFTESFYEAIFSEVHSVGYVARQWDTFGLDIVTSRIVNYQSADINDKITIRKLPSVEFSSRDREIFKRRPLWLSFETGAGLVSRSQPLFQSRSFVERLDVAPTITTAVHWAGFSLVPSFGVRETHWGSSQTDYVVNGSNLLRSSRELNIDLVPPALERIYKPPKWLGEKLKHVIEPRAEFKWVSGVSDFGHIIRFDQAELLSNTQQLEVGLVNRLYAKRKDGQVNEVLTWQVFQQRYFDPTFGGAIVAGQRNVVLSTAEFTDYSFLDRPRRYSPVVSDLRVTPDPRIGFEWRSDYDPLRSAIVNSSFTVDGRLSNYFISAGHNQVRYTPLSQGPNDVNPINVLAPNSNQFRGMVGIGQENKRGWSTGFSAVYDYRVGILQYATTQVTYNTDCCGFSVQYRRFSFGTRNENQFRLSFALANVGSVGTLRRQERMF
jgi:LPS-assembly protein